MRISSLICTVILLLGASTAAAAQHKGPDAQLIGVWGVDKQGGYDFRADGTFVMEGSVTYEFDASGGVWHYWQAATPAIRVTAEYKISADGKSLSINLKKGKPFAHLVRIK